MIEIPKIIISQHFFYRKMFYFKVGDSNCHLKGANVIVRPLSRKDIFYSRSIYSINNEDYEQNEKVSVEKSF